MADRQIRQFDPNPGQFERIRIATQRDVTGSGGWRSEYLTLIQVATALGGDFEAAGAAAAAIAAHLTAFDHDDFVALADLTAALAGHTGATDPHPQYLTQAEATALFAPLGEAGGPGLRYTWSTATSGDPASGAIRGNAALASITSLVIHESDRNGVGLSLLFDDLANGAKIQITKESAEETYAWFRVTGAFTDGGTFRTYPVALIGSAGTLANNDEVSIGLYGAAATAGISGIEIEEVDGTPTGTVTKIIVPNGSLAIAGSDATLTLASGVGAIIGGTLNTFGDSITAGLSATTDADRWANLVAANTGWTLTNQGVNGTEALDGADLVYGFDPADAKFSILAFGFNDLRNYQANANGQSTFAAAIQALAAWAAIPAVARLKAQAAGITYAGTWANATRYGVSNLGRDSSSAGATATFAFNGSALIVGYTRLFTGTGTFTIAIDGGSAITVTGANAQAAASGRNYGPAVAVIQNLDQTDHTAVITVSSGTVALDWFAGVGENFSNYSGPCCFVGNVIRMGPSAFTAPPSQATINSYIGIYNNLIKVAVANLARIGLRVYGANPNNRFTTANWAADQIHPNNAGHLQIASAYIDAIRQSPGLLLNGGTGSGGGGGGGSTATLEDTFTAADGTAIIGRTPDAGSAWYKIVSGAGNGAITGNKAGHGGAQLAAASNVGLTSYTLDADFETANGGTNQIAFWLRAGAANSSQGIVIAIQGGNVYWYDATGSTYNTLRTDAFTTPTTGHITITVTPSAISANINSGAYSQTVTTALYVANTGVGFGLNAATDKLDNLIIP